METWHLVVHLEGDLTFNRCNLLHPSRGVHVPCRLRSLVWYARFACIHLWQVSLTAPCVDDARIASLLADIIPARSPHATMFMASS